MVDERTGVCTGERLQLNFSHIAIGKAFRGRSAAARKRLGPDKKEDTGTALDGGHCMPLQELGKICGLLPVSMVDGDNWGQSLPATVLLATCGMRFQCLANRNQQAGRIIVLPGSVNTVPLASAEAVDS